MKTLDELQNAIDEIREVCRKHGVVLIGTCECESIYGEITISENVMAETGWSNLEEVDFNAVKQRGKSFDIGGIGDFIA